MKSESSQLAEGVSHLGGAGNGISAEAIVQELRSQIIAGTLSPGAQLPTRVQLQERFGTTNVTVQRALDRLIREEFVYANGRRGTYVAEAPPHLSRYALVFPSRPSVAHEWRRFWTALSHEAMALEQNEEVARQLPLYHGINEHLEGEDYARLQAEVLTHRVAGLIFAALPHRLIDTPLLREPQMPRVAIVSGEFSGVPTMRLDLRAFCRRACEHLAARGCRRVALILPSSLSADAHEIWLEAMGEHGLTTRPYWTQHIHLAAPEAAKNCTHLLMNPDQRERPDALIISDDNLVEHAMAGLIAAGVQVPRHLSIVAHCNFPWPTQSILPATRLGFDARQLLQACLDSIDAQRRGETVASQTLIEPVFENELAASSRPLNRREIPLARPEMAGLAA